MINRRFIILTNGFNSASGGKRLFTKLLEILEKIGKNFLIPRAQPVASLPILPVLGIDSFSLFFPPYPF